MQASSSRLTPLQWDLLAAFFERTDSFFLTGGAALSGFYLGHRETKDLDLFATPDADIEDGARALRSAATALGAEAGLQQESPDFRRFNVKRGEELTLVDLVIDRAPQIVAEKPRIGSLRVDALDEIAVNKLCTLLGRSVPRDLMDLKLLLERGYGLDGLLEKAKLKEGGIDAATLAWVLSEARVGPLAAVPPETTAAELDAFRLELVGKLTRLALPPDSLR